jgi:hypothetical protein
MKRVEVMKSSPPSRPNNRIVCSTAHRVRSIGARRSTRITDGAGAGVIRT